jgi:hypothetical protein
VSRFCIQVSWDEVPHLTEQQKSELESSYPLHEREARRMGIPSLGSGKIYPIEEASIIVDPFAIPDHWARGYGMDVGWNRTAALFAAHDRDTDTVYFTDEYYAGHMPPALHAHSIKLKGGDWMTGAIDPAAEKAIANQNDGTRIMEEYVELDLDLIRADNSREAGILATYNRMTSGRLKVFRNCQNWISEFRIYRRNERGIVVKENDHLMDSGRYYLMSGIPVSKTKPNKNDWEWTSSLSGDGAWMGG